VVAAFAVAALAVALGPHVVGDVFTETDFYGSYGPGARALQQGQLDASRYAVVGPMFELLLAAAGLIVRDLFTAAELLAVASMTAALALWGSLLARRLGPLAGLLAIAFLASNAQFFRYAWSATTDAPALALQAASLWALLGGRPHAGATHASSARRIAAAGLLAGLAFLTRYNSIALLPAGLAALAFGWTGSPRGARLRHALVFGGAFLAPVLPWTIVSLAQGVPLQTKLHHNIAFEVYARPHGIVWDIYARDLEPQFPTLWSVLARDPAAVVSRLLFNLFDHLRLDARILTGWPLALTALAGTWFAWRDRRLGVLAPVLLAMALLFMTLVPAFHSERYSLAVLPAWAALAACAFASPRYALPLARVWWKLLLLPAVLLPALAAARAITARTLDQLPVEVLEAARQVRPLLKSGDRVLARKPHFGWYAGLETAPLPLADTLSQWADAARRERARWLYFSWPEAQLRPRFEWLLDSTSAAPGLTVRAATTHWPAVVYEIGTGFGADPAWMTNDTLVAVHRARARALYDSRAREPRVFLAMYEMANGNHDEAQVYLDRLLALDPADAEVLLMSADNRLALQDPAGALEYHGRLEQVRPGTAEAQVILGWVAAMRGDEARAAHIWAPVAQATSDLGTLRRMAVAFARTGNTEKLEEVRVRLRQLGWVE
jgi:tetratricopeptide (TPR) repeat protein